MSDRWCPACARSVTPATVTPPSAWLAGCMGCAGCLALLAIALAVLVLAILAVRQLPASDSESVTYNLVYPVARSGGVLIALLLALTVGGAIVRWRRRSVCPICRTTLRPPAARSSG